MTNTVTPFVLLVWTSHSGLRFSTETMNLKQNGNRRYSRLWIFFASVLIFLGSVALFAVMQSGAPSIFIAAVRGQFYTPVANSSFAERFLGAFALVGFAKWPIVAFLGLWAGATYVISTLLSSGDRLPAIRRWAVGTGLSLVSSTVLAAVWFVVAGRSSQ